MRKQNDSILPTLTPDSRLIDAVTRSRKCKRPNAQKHGLFARPLIIPGEDPREFDQILAELIAEWKPSGPTLRDALADLAETKFRKRRLKNYVQTELHLSILTILPSMRCGVSPCLFITWIPIQKPVLISTRKNICAPIKLTI